MNRSSSTRLALVIALLMVGPGHVRADENRMNARMEAMKALHCRDDEFLSKACYSLGHDLYLVQITIPFRILTYSDSFIDCRSLQQVRLGKYTGSLRRDRFAAAALSVAATGAEDAVLQMVTNYNSGASRTDIGSVSPADCSALRGDQ